MTWKTLVKTKITAFHESQLRSKAANSQSLEFFNVQLLGLTGIPHPALRGISETRDAYKLRAHLKFLLGDILSSKKLARERGGDPKCRLCNAQSEDSTHILVECPKTAETRHRLLPELLNLVASIKPLSPLLISQNILNENLAQCIVDPSSTNLPCSLRVSFQHPRLSELYRLSHDWCFAVYNDRARLSKEQ